MDRMRIITDQLFLTEAAAAIKGTIEPYTRRVTNDGKQRPNSMVLTLRIDSYAFLRLICRRLDCGRWQVSVIDVNLPGHLYGHNARVVKDDRELALALTRVRHFASLVTETAGHSRIIPSTDWKNNSFIRSVEAMIQVQDPGHRILVGSHICQKTNQRRPHLVCWGQSTSIKGEDLALSFYDKAAQRKSGKVTPKGVPGTRIECIVKNSERLADEAIKTGVYTGDPGEVVKTLSLETAYAIIRQNLGKLSGFDLNSYPSPEKRNKVADLIFMGLGNRAQDPHAVDQALENYMRQHKPCGRTFREVSKHLRALTVHQVAYQSMHLLPEDRRHLSWSDIRNPAAEKDFSLLCRDLNAPEKPDPEVLDAWSVTSFLKEKPASLDLVGHTFPSFSMPWRQTL